MNSGLWINRAFGLSRICGAAFIAGAIGPFAGMVQPAYASILEGRWKSIDGILLVDVVPCGDVFCGRLVGKGNRCLGQILKLKPVEDDPLVLSGELDLAENYGSYTVYAIIRGKEGERPQMKLIGGDRTHSVFSRSMPVDVLLTRVGEAACQPQGISGRQNVDKATLSAAS
jgi:hypothetical protein